jgi:hypothetical protein
MVRDFIGLKKQSCQIWGGLTFGRFRFLTASRGHKGVGTDQTKGFDTCIDQK